MSTYKVAPLYILFIAIGCNVSGSYIVKRKDSRNRYLSYTITHSGRLFVRA